MVFLRKRSRYNTRLDGEKVNKGGCIACHESDGIGAPQMSTVFTRLMLSGVHGLRRDDAGAEWQLEGEHGAWRTIAWAFVD
ncbi:MAG: hypothetical protein ABI158_06260 [Edaphobacter sp.]